MPYVVDKSRRRAAEVELATCRVASDLEARGVERWHAAAAASRVASARKDARGGWHAIHAALPGGGTQRFRSVKGVGDHLVRRIESGEFEEEEEIDIIN